MERAILLISLKLNDAKLIYTAHSVKKL
uniref:Uncharacterized protein n=1 Tax=Arundo donax TaxID=35708 RepID=A0A0A8YW30_ARUDO